MTTSLPTLNKTEFAASIASTRREARKAGWTLPKVDAAEQCACEWANATQNTRNETWHDGEWRQEAAAHFASFTDDNDDGYWQECCGFIEEKETKQ